jgi:hypothetical protein
MCEPSASWIHAESRFPIILRTLASFIRLSGTGATLPGVVLAIPSVTLSRRRLAILVQDRGDDQAKCDEP